MIHCIPYIGAAIILLFKSFLHGHNMSWWLNFVFGQDVLFIGALVSCAFTVALLAYVVRTVSRSFVHSVMEEIQFWRIVVRWLVESLPKGITNLDAVFAIFDATQPTPYTARSSLIPKLMFMDKPEDLQIILNHSNALEKLDVYRLLTPTIGDTLVGVKVSEWKWRRRNMVPFFSTNKLRMYSRDMYETSQLELEKLLAWADTDKELDLWDPISGINFKIATESLLGIKPEEICTDPEIQGLMHDVQCMSERFMERIMRVWLHPNFVYAVVKKFNGVSQILERLNEFVKKVIRHRRKMIIGEAEKGQHEADRVLLDCLSTSFFKKDGCDMSKALIDETGLLYSAASETSAVSGCFTLLLLAMNPNIQDQLCAEIDQVLGTNDDERPVTIEHVENMPLLDRCIKDGLRLYPAVPIFGRRVTSTIKLSDGGVAEKGTNILVSAYNLHRKPELYDNPYVFYPDHFLPENVQKRHPYSFLPFSAGPRGCPGYKFAMISMKITLATMLRKYRLTTDMKMEDMAHKLDMVLRSANGWKIKLHTRR